MPFHFTLNLLLGLGHFPLGLSKSDINLTPSNPGTINLGTADLGSRGTRSGGGYFIGYFTGYALCYCVDGLLLDVFFYCFGGFPPELFLVQTQ